MYIIQKNSFHAFFEFWKALQMQSWKKWNKLIQNGSLELSF
jgi:hypothetical protein